MSEQLSLNGAWELRRLDQQEVVYSTQVPGSVFSTLISEGVLPDPAYRENESIVLAYADNDFQLRKAFDVEEDFLKHDKVELVFEGIDTLSRLYLNGMLIAETDNMHRTYRLDVHDQLQAGENELVVKLFSPTHYVAEKHKTYPLHNPDQSVMGYGHLRKASYMFGWDWGPKVPDFGLWKPVTLRAYNTAQLHDVRVQQKHAAGQVDLEVEVTFEKWGEGPFSLEVLLSNPVGKPLSSSRLAWQGAGGEEPNAAVQQLHFVIEDPELWWPVGYGDQPLYQVQTSLVQGSEVLDSKTFKVGLREIKLLQAQDEQGESFTFVVNQLPIFLKGANYIPEENLLDRYTHEKTENLIRSSVAANMNVIRVWGGGFYPHDNFMELCDQYGVLVWMDFMFGCSTYPGDQAFLLNVQEEVKDNVRRLRHHASLLLWCGNNEVEEAMVYWGWNPSEELKTAYLQIFEKDMPLLLKELDPQTPYWPSSPSTGGNFVDPRMANRGDAHYWEVYNGEAPFEKYLDQHFRFVSEFGFQSFPSIETLSTVTEPKDRNIFSPVMESHQKKGGGNRIILNYIAEHYRYPNDFDSLLYISQLLQAEAIKTGVEHWRRERGYCMGTIYWQLNDVWPGPSWSSMDYYHRWKALHYYAKRFYQPLLLSVHPDANQVTFFVTNDTRAEVQGTIKWTLRTNTEIVESGVHQMVVSGGAVESVVPLDFSEALNTTEKARSTYLVFELEVDGEKVSGGTHLFVKPKHFAFADPALSVVVEESEDGEAFLLELSSEALAKGVEIKIDDEIVVLSDNFIDLSAGDPQVLTIEKAQLKNIQDLDDLVEKLNVRSYYDACY
jgi:beta-mannosidase